MRVLILSCNTGGGHNACAEAIRQAFEAAGDTCVSADTSQLLKIPTIASRIWTTTGRSWKNVL